MHEVRVRILKMREKERILVVKDLSSVRKFTDKYNIMVWLTCNMLS